MQFGFLDVDDKYKKLTKLGDPLAKIDALFDFSIFKKDLEKTSDEIERQRLSNPKGAGRKPLERMRMLKIVFLKKFFNLSHAQTEFQITDRHSFQRFIGLDPNQDAPDYSSVWRFEERLSENGLLQSLFERFDAFLTSKGFEAQEGTIVDATIVEVPRQRNTRDENKQIKQGEIPESFMEKQSILSQKDVDARWTKKNAQNYYGYKNHILIDSKHKLIRDYEVTAANVHDSQPAPGLFSSAIPNRPGYGDSAYISDEIQAKLDSNNIENRINEKGYKNKPLTEQQRDENRQKSKIRSRVEHVFGFMVNSMNGKTIRTIGIKRANLQIGLSNLAYNIARYTQLIKIQSTL